jgi:FAD:protein FMN transferase
MQKSINETKVFMNTKVNIQVSSELGTIETNDILDKAFGRFAYVVKKYSRFEFSSDLSRLNYSKQFPKQISDELFFLINTTLKLAKLSDGIYDPTILDILEIYGYGIKKNIPTKSKFNDIVINLKKEIKNRASWKDIKMNKSKSEITLKQDQKIDLGSIGKGYAMDLAAKELNPVKNFLINAGGDILASGKDINNNHWRIGLTCPWDINKIFGVLELKNISLACSGSAAIKYGKFHHLINPKNGKPMNKIEQSFVIHKSAMLADGFATLLYLTGMDGLSILEDQKAGGMIIKGKKYFKNKYFPELMN